ncbi:hypothetical protein GBAR_LOCUS15037 [Geodia barretti]|uniref:Uncharacterized protein n=1 Tax=Geodia barretti TaxID=519541 RepID=A0AA35SAW6_GEOBA|nr:hypothetical protein GBAR_LOCUS15037 [Geodia barretti]
MTFFANFRMIFPTILVFYMTISILIVEFIVLLSFMDRPTLFCGSPDLIQSLRSSTDFCKINGKFKSCAYDNIWQ